TSPYSSDSCAGSNGRGLRAFMVRYSVQVSFDIADPYSASASPSRTIDPLGRVVGCLQTLTLTSTVGKKLPVIDGLLVVEDTVNLELRCMRQCARHRQRGACRSDRVANHVDLRWPGRRQHHR